MLCPNVSWEEMQHIRSHEFIKKAGHILLQNYFFFSAIKKVFILALINSNWSQWKDLTQTWNLLSRNLFAELPRKKQLNREIGKLSDSVFLLPLPGPCLLQLCLIILRVAGAMGEFSKVQWGSSKNVSLWAFLALCILLCQLWLPAVFKVLYAQGTSYVFLFVPRIFLESEYPKLMSMLY